MRSPILEGFVPCGACASYVDLCTHYKIKSILSTTKVHFDDPIEQTKRKILSRARGECQTCGRKTVRLLCRPAALRHDGGRISLRNGIAICLICRAEAHGLDLSDWVATEQAPELADLLVAKRRKRNLPV